jgi:hypothetical protein
MRQQELGDDRLILHGKFCIYHLNLVFTGAVVYSSSDTGSGLELTVFEGFKHNEHDDVKDDSVDVRQSLEKTEVIVPQSSLHGYQWNLRGPLWHNHLRQSCSVAIKKAYSAREPFRCLFVVCYTSIVLLWRIQWHSDSRVHVGISVLASPNFAIGT